MNLTFLTLFSMAFFLLASCGGPRSLKQNSSPLGTNGGTASQQNLQGASPGDESEASSTSADVQVLDGVINGGGGKGVLCEKNGKTSLETLDIYEGRGTYGFTFPQLDTEEEAAIFLAKRLTRYFSDGHRPLPLVEYDEEAVRNLSDEFDFKFIKPGQSLNLTQDAHSAYIEEGCKEVQLAIFYNESSVLMDPKYWDMLDPLNKLALFYHEMLYHQLRVKENQTNSIEARKVVAMLFSEQEPTPIYFLDATEEQEIFHCSGNTSKNDHYMEGSILMSVYEVLEKDFTGMEFVFNNFFGASLYFRQSSRLSTLSLDAMRKLSENEYTDFSEAAPIKKYSYQDTKYNMKFVIDRETKSAHVKLYDHVTNKLLKDYQIYCSPPKRLKHRKVENRGELINEKFFEKISSKKFVGKGNSNYQIEFLGTSHFVIREIIATDAESESCWFQGNAEIKNIIRTHEEVRNRSLKDYQYEIVYEISSYEQIGEPLEKERDQKLCEATIEAYSYNADQEIQTTPLKLNSSSEFIWDGTVYEAESLSQEEEEDRY